MVRLCAYKSVFGNPGEGVHSYRVFGLAIVDVLGTFGLAFVVKGILGISYSVALAVTFALGILAHWIFCVPTALNKSIGLR